MSGDGTSISYSTTGSESPFITIGDETPAGDWGVEVRGVSMQPGATLQLQIDEANGTLSLLNLGGMGPSSYSLYVDHTGKDYDQEFGHGGISLGPNDRVTLTYGTWTRDSEGMPLDYDHGNAYE
mgnify:FL=1